MLHDVFTITADQCSCIQLCPLLTRFGLLRNLSSQTNFMLTHGRVPLHDDDLHPSSHPLLLLKPVGDGPSHHAPSHDHNVCPLRRQVGVDLQRSPAAAWKNICSFLLHSCQLSLQVCVTKLLFTAQSNLHFTIRHI